MGEMDTLGKMTSGKVNAYGAFQYTLLVSVDSLIMMHVYGYV